MTDGNGSKFTIFELYLATAEKVTDRRALANSWMLSVNSAIVRFMAIFSQIRQPSGLIRKQSGYGQFRRRARLFVSLARHSLLPTENLAVPNLL